MSQHATELCLLLVDDVYGELTSRVFGTLITYGRLAFPAIVHLSALTPRQVKHGLAVLIQQHLALWHSIDSATFYEADWTNAYALIRLGKLVKAVEDRFGDAMSGLMSTLILSGHTQIRDLAQAYYIPCNGGSQKSTKHGSLINTDFLTNGDSKNGDNAQETFHESMHTNLHALLQAGFLTIVSLPHFRSDADNRAEAEDIVGSRPMFQGLLKGDKKLLFDEAIKEQLEAWKFGTELGNKAIEKFKSSISSKGKKRQLEEETAKSRPKKRVRIDDDDDHINGNDDHINSNGNSVIVNEAVYLEENAVLGVNRYKLEIVARNEKLVQIVGERIGLTTSRVYGELLRQVEKLSKCCNPTDSFYINSDDDEDLGSLPNVSTADIAAAEEKISDLSEDMASRAGECRVDINHIIQPKKHRKKSVKDEEPDEASTGEEDNLTDEDENDDISDGEKHNDIVKKEGGNNNGNISRQAKPTTNGHSTSAKDTYLDLARQHLLLLADHPYQFVVYIPSQNISSERWAINFPALTYRLRLVELENIISARYSIGALRVVRILQEKGKLDEKALAGFSLLNQKTLRGILTAMHEGGHLELQEIPRDTQRQPSRTMFFWHFDIERCRQKVLEETYKTMARCMQRMKVERSSVQSIIDKAARSDVKGKEDKFLSAGERTALETWRIKEERMLGAIGRLDDLVGILRDF